MTERQFSHYHVAIEAGPGHVQVDVLVEYFDLHDELVGCYGEHLIAFATTWKDVAEVIRKGLKLLGLDVDPVHNVSPMVDLS
jgi:hypothetical protein